MPPKIFPCGGEGQPACPPVPAADIQVSEEEIIAAALRMSDKAKERLRRLLD